jgi:hypothetical protein
MYTEYLKHIQKMDMEQRGKLFTAILCYAAGEEIPELDAAADMAFSFIQDRMDRDNAAYMEKCEKRREAGKLGGRPKTNASDENQTKAKKANGFSEKQNNPDNDNEPDNDTDISSNDNRVIAPADKTLCAGKFLLNDGTEYEVSENDVVTYQQLYPGIDVRQELRNIQAWCLSNSKYRKTRGGAKRFMNSWLSRSQNGARKEQAVPEKKTRNRFNDFEQRECDYADLERTLLNTPVR